MIRTSLRKTLLLPMAALGVILAVTSGTVVAQTKPFAIAGVGTAPQGLPLPGDPQGPRPHNIVGVATHLGLHTGSGEVQTDTVDLATLTGDFHGKFTFQKLNGDKLVCDYGNTNAGATVPGTYALTVVGQTDDMEPIVTALFIAEFVVDPDNSTGKYKGVTGSWVMYAQSGPFVLGSSESLNYGWVGAGFLKFPKK